MYYVYILQSQKDNSFYIGVTNDLKRRLYQHNIGNSAFSSTKAPFTIKWYCAFTEKEKAYSFEKYLKSSSGYAFWKKRFI
ncbi:GIY-YIG nuclease family protein [Candidatus Parcubacteria bacterium]|nr:GIY-YIG nuclease family protein [Candidatus Parcubacteria bacterium]